MLTTPTRCALSNAPHRKCITSIPMAYALDAFSSFPHPTETSFCGDAAAITVSTTSSCFCFQLLNKFPLCLNPYIACGKVQALVRLGSAERSSCTLLQALRIPFCSILFAEFKLALMAYCDQLISKARIRIYTPACCVIEFYHCTCLYPEAS